MRLRQVLPRALTLILPCVRWSAAQASQARRFRTRPLAANAFTLVELLVVLSIIGVLMSLLLAGVQASRESARRIKCANNLRNQILALQNFHSAFDHFPAGQLLSGNTEYSWCFHALSFLEQASLKEGFDPKKSWNDARNLALAQTSLPIFRCPSARLKFDGKTDYGGIIGSVLTNDLPPGVFEFSNGVMLEVGRVRPSAIRLAEVTDGASHTLLAAESSDRDKGAPGMWVSGFNCFSHDSGQISGPETGEILSLHPGGAYGGFADGRVQFLSKQTAIYVVGALCTRNGGEVVGEF